MSRGLLPATIWLLLAACPQAALPVRAADEVHLAERANRVKQMTAEERARLQKNIERFEKYSPEEKAAYRQLSTTVEGDPALKQLMSTYTAWLQTLTPGQREELRLEQDINKRRDLVEKFRKEQQEKEEFSLPELEPGGRMTPPPPLSKGELAAVLKVIEAVIPESRKQLFPDARDEIGQLERASAIASALFWGSPDGGQSFPLPFDQMLENVTSPLVKAFVTAPDQERFKVFAWGGVIIVTVRQEAERELQKRTPGDDVLSKYFAELDPSKRFELNNQFRGSDWRREVVALYFQDHPNEDINRLFVLRQRWRRPGERGSGFDGRGGPRPGFPPRNGDGGGPPRPGERARELIPNGPLRGPRPPTPSQDETK